MGGNLSKKSPSSKKAKGSSSSEVKPEHKTKNDIVASASTAQGGSESTSAGKTADVPATEPITQSTAETQPTNIPPTDNAPNQSSSRPQTPTITMTGPDEGEAEPTATSTTETPTAPESIETQPSSQSIENTPPASKIESKTTDDNRPDISNAGNDSDSVVDEQTPAEIIKITDKKVPIKVFVGTWNVGNAAPSDDLSLWLQTKSEGNNNCDIYAIGVQECEYAPRDGYETCEDDWNNVLTTNLGEDYQMMHTLTISPLTENTFKDQKAFLRAVQEGRARAGEIRITLFVKKSLVPHVSELDSDLKTTGRLNGLSGNKGGLAVSFKLFDTRLCFINAHLNAHTEFLERRIQDMFNINWGLSNGPINDEEGPVELDFDVSNQFHYCFIFGDLNYRIELETEEVQELISKNEIATLLENDQLLSQRKLNRIYTPFHEELITFKPTFKLKKRNIELYDTQRTPSYCDRILVKSFDGCPIKYGKYGSSMEIISSDHKPVHQLYDIELSNDKSDLNKDASAIEISVTNMQCKNLIEMRNIINEDEGEEFPIDSPFITMLFDNDDEWQHASSETTKVEARDNDDIQRDEADTNIDDKQKEIDNLYKWESNITLTTSSTRSLDQLSSAHVYFCVRDKDNLQNRLGEAIICLKDVVKSVKQNLNQEGSDDTHVSPNGSYDFSVKLIQYGLYCGTFEGTLHLNTSK